MTFDEAMQRVIIAGLIVLGLVAIVGILCQHHESVTALEYGYEQQGDGSWVLPEGGCRCDREGEGE